MPVERITITLPSGFDPARHGKALDKLISDKHGDGWEVDHIDPAKLTATASRQAAITEVTARAAEAGAPEPESFDVRLAKGAKPADGEKISTKLEDQYPGFYVTSFEPFLGKATLTELDDATARCRGAVSIALGVKPWEVQVRPRKDGGFDLDLPKSYVPSKHDDKLDEVATAVVGVLGWTVRANPQKLTASIIPGLPPTFPPMVPYPFDAKVEVFSQKSDKWARIPIGVNLSDDADVPGKPLFLDLEASPHTQISGTSGAGKSVVINGIISGVLARDAELVIVDLPSKAVDFMWCKDLVRPGGWGCENLAESVTALALVYEEGERRAKLLARHGVTKWTDLPEGLGLKPIVVIVDEVTGLFFPEEVPKGLPKDHPLVTVPTEVNLLKATLRSYIARAAAELRFVGVKVLLSSQVSSTTTGVPTAIRMNLGNKMLLGSRPTDNNRKLSLSDAGAVPKVPANVASDDKAGRGVGVAEFEGQVPSVFKGFFASVGDFSKWLDSRGVVRTDRPRPTASEVARHTPSLDDGGGGGPMGGDSAFSDGGRRPRATGSARKPPAAGGGASNDTLGTGGSVVSDAFKSTETCATCGGPIDAMTGACHCSR
jgi:hypothetical protein